MLKHTEKASCHQLVSGLDAAASTACNRAGFSSVERAEHRRIGNRRITLWESSPTRVSPSISQSRRTDESVGTIDGTCADLIVPISGFNVTVKCLTYQPAGDDCRSVNRFATYLAEVRSSGESEVLYRSSAEVAYRFDPNRAPKVEVRQFVSSTSGPVTTQPLSFYSSPSSATTTSTSTTTTTTAPATVMLVKLSTPEREVPPKTSKNRWRAAATSTVVDKTAIC